MTALVVKIMALLESVAPVDHQGLSDSVAWLIHNCQQPDGSFTDKSYRPNKIVVSSSSCSLSCFAAGMLILLFCHLQQAAGATDQSVFLTAFVLVALHKATNINDPILQLQVRPQLCFI